MVVLFLFFNSSYCYLKSPDFFDAEQFPTMTLVSTGIEKDGSNYRMHAISPSRASPSRSTSISSSTASAATRGAAPEPASRQRADVNRKDWGLEWNVALETGGVLLGDKVKLELEIQAVKA